MTSRRRSRTNAKKSNNKKSNILDNLNSLTELHALMHEIESAFFDLGLDQTAPQDQVSREEAYARACKFKAEAESFYQQSADTRIELNHVGDSDPLNTAFYWLAVAIYGPEPSRDQLSSELLKELSALIDISNRAYFEVLPDFDEETVQQSAWAFSAPSDPQGRAIPTEALVRIIIEHEEDCCAETYEMFTGADRCNPALEQIYKLSRNFYLPPQVMAIMSSIIEDQGPQSILNFIHDVNPGYFPDTKLARDILSGKKKLTDQQVQAVLMHGALDILLLETMPEPLPPAGLLDDENYLFLGTEPQVMLYRAALLCLEATHPDLSGPQEVMIGCSAHAAFMFGMARLTGTHVPLDHYQAAGWLTYAALCGHPLAYLAYSVFIAMQPYDNSGCNYLLAASTFRAWSIYEMQKFADALVCVPFDHQFKETLPDGTERQRSAAGTLFYNMLSASIQFDRVRRQQGRCTLSELTDRQLFRRTAEHAPFSLKSGILMDYIDDFASMELVTLPYAEQTAILAAVMYSAHLDSESSLLYEQSFAWPFFLHSGLDREEEEPNGPLYAHRAVVAQDAEHLMHTQDLDEYSRYMLALFWDVAISAIEQGWSCGFASAICMAQDGYLSKRILKLIPEIMKQARRSNSWAEELLEKIYFTEDVENIHDPELPHLGKQLREIWHLTGEGVRVDELQMWSWIKMQVKAAVSLDRLRDKETRTELLGFAWSQIFAGNTGAYTALAQLYLTDKPLLACSCWQLAKWSGLNVKGDDLEKLDAQASGRTLPFITEMKKTFAQAEQGDQFSCWVIAAMYFYGIILPADLHLSEKYLRMALVPNFDLMTTELLAGDTYNNFSRPFFTGTSGGLSLTALHRRCKRDFGLVKQGQMAHEHFAAVLLDYLPRLCEKLKRPKLSDLEDYVLTQAVSFIVIYGCANGLSEPQSLVKNLPSDLSPLLFWNSLFTLASQRPDVLHSHEDLGWSIRQLQIYKHVKAKMEEMPQFKDHPVLTYLQGMFALRPMAIKPQLQLAAQYFGRAVIWGSVGAAAWSFADLNPLVGAKVLSDPQQLPQAELKGGDQKTGGDGTITVQAVQ